jgi:hypothetical protein
MTRGAHEKVRNSQRFLYWPKPIKLQYTKKLLQNSRETTSLKDGVLGHAVKRYSRNFMKIEMLNSS